MTPTPEFTPVSAAVGGLLIGLAAAILLWLNGRVAASPKVGLFVLSMRLGMRHCRWMPEPRA